MKRCLPYVLLLALVSTGISAQTAKRSAPESKAASSFDFSRRAGGGKPEPSTRYPSNFEGTDPFLSLFEEDGALGIFDRESELLDLRDAFSKHFKNPNGTITALMSAGPQHYEKDGLWHTIVNDIHANPSSNGGAYPHANTYNKHHTFYGNGTADLFLMKEADSPIFSLRQPRLSFWDEHGQELGSNHFLTFSDVRISGNKMIYAEICPGIDLEVEQNAAGFKYSYVIKNAQALSNLPAGTVSLGITETLQSGAGFVMMEDGTSGRVKFSNGDKSLSFSKFLFYDSHVNKNREKASRVSWNNGQLSYAMAAEWFTNPNRIYPIYIDPTVTYTPTASSWWTGTLDDDSGCDVSTDNDNDDEIRIGYDDGTADDDYYSGFAKFNINSLPANACVQNAYSRFYQFNFRNTQSGAQCWGNDDQLQYYYGGIGPYTFDPTPASCDAISAAITAAPVYQTLDVFSGYPFSTANGWKDYNSYNLNTAVTTARSAQNYMTVSFDQFGSHSDPSFQFCCFCTPDNDDWIDYRGWSDGNRPQLVVTYETPYIIGTAANISTNNVCAGTSVTLTLTGGTNGSDGSWHWYSGSCGGTAVGTSTAANASVTISAPATTTTYYVRGEGTCGNTACQSVTLTVLQPSVAATAINASSNPICQGGSGTTLSVVGGALGAGANWQWYTNGCGTTAAGSGAAINVNPAVTTIYYVRAEGTCNTTVCRQVTVTVNTPTVGGTPAVSVPSVCINNTVGITLSGENGAVLFWEMQYNGGGYSSIGNAGLSTITSPSLTVAGTYDFRARVQNSPCAALYSNITSVTVVPASVGGTSAPALSPICLNGNSTVSLSGNIGAVVNWERQINGGGWVNIGQSGLGSIPTGVLSTAGTWEYRAVVQNSPCATATSAMAVIMVNAVSVGGTASASGILLCNGANPTISIAGNTGAVLYWERQVNGGGFNNIGNAGLTSFNAGALATGTYDYRAVIQNSPCATATSTSVSITVSSPSVGGTAIPTVSQLCAGGSTNITLSGSTGTILNWEQQVSGGGWVNIGNGGVSIIASGTLVAGTNEFRAIVQNGGCSSTTSVPAVISVDSISVGGAVTSNLPSVCDGSTITLTLSGQTGSIAQWERQFNGGGWNSLANGGINPLTTAPLTPFGTYEFRALIQSGVCTSVYSSSVSVNVTQNDNPAFSYPSSVYCQGTANPSPTIALGGGSFSVSPAGLAINTSNGIIDLSASMPGTYTVTHTTSGICSSSATQIITVTPSQNAGFNYGSLSYCLNAGTNPVPTVTTAGGVFTTLNPGLIFSNASTGEVNLALSQPGSYFVQYSLGGSCPSSTVQTVILNAVGVSTFTYPANNYCQAGTNPVPTISQFGGTFSATPSGLVFANNQTGEIDLDLSAPNTYTITYNSGGICPTTTTRTITINVSVNPLFSYATSSFCSNGTDPVTTVSPVGGTFTTSPSGLSIDGAGTIDLSASVAGAYSVSYTAPGLCGTTANTNVIVVAAPQANIQPVGNLCTGSGTSILTASPSGGVWSGGAYISAGGVFDPMVSGAGSFPVNYLVNGSGGCNASATYNVVVNASPSVSITTIPSLCSNDTSYVLTATPNGGTWSGNPFVSVNGLFYPLFAGQGTHSVIYTVNNGNCSSSASANITVLNTPIPTINPTGTICTSGGVVGLSANVAGGTWSGGAYISASGTFTPSLAAVGNNTVTYTIASGTCTAQATTQIAVSGGPNVNLLTPTPFCVNDAPAFILANIPGGVFTGGSYVSGTGLFSPADAVLGNNVVMYSLVGNNGCVGADTVNVVVNANPDATITYPGIICEDASAVTLATATVGGVWSGGAYINSGVFDPAVAGLGSHNVTYTVTTGGCSSSASISITIDPKPIALFNSQPNGLLVYFTDLSQHADSWSWNFGDGSAEITTQSPTHPFPDNGTYQVRLIVFNDCGSDTIIRAVMVNKALGIDENSISGNIQVFPNPAADYIQLSANHLGNVEWSMKVLDMSGKTITQEMLYPTSGELNKTIDIYALKPGVYFIHLSDGDKYHSLKFIKL